MPNKKEADAFCGFTLHGFFTRRFAKRTQKHRAADSEAAVNYCETFVKSIISNTGISGWNSNTKPSEVIKTYDIDGTVNAYIINLQTNGQKSGYVLEEVYTSSPDVVEYALDGEYKVNAHETASHYADKGLVYDGDRTFFYRKSGNLYNAENDRKVTLDTRNLRKSYTEMASSDEKTLSSQKAEVISSLAVSKSSASGKVNSSKNIPGLSKFTPFTMDHYNASAGWPEDAGTCKEAGGTNMLLYWNRSRYIHGLFISGSAEKTFKSLLSYMKCDSVNGTDPINGYNGMKSYISGKKITSYKGRDYRTRSGFSWAYIKTNISNGNAMAFCAQTYYYTKNKKDKDQNHVFLAVGYQDTSAVSMCGWRTNGTILLIIITSTSGPTSMKYGITGGKIRIL